MAKKLLYKYLNRKTDIYHLIDEEFLNSFSEKQRMFMLIYYYEKYKKYCDEKNLLPLSMDVFLKNANRRKIKMLQVCCPYCGYIDLVIRQSNCTNIRKIGYCVKCGRKSTAEYIFLQLSAYLRLREVHRAGIVSLKNTYENDKMQIISYDVFHMELIQITSILEKTLRDFFTDLSFVIYKNHNSLYIEELIRKSTGNDFMLWEKANGHYKKALGIDLKQLITKECRNNLTDLANIRNVVVHNNGMIDDKFKKTTTFQRLSDVISGDLIFITDEMIAKYLGSVLELIGVVETEFNKVYKAEMHSLIANYYFGK